MVVKVVCKERCGIKFQLRPNLYFLMHNSRHSLFHLSMLSATVNAFRFAQNRATDLILELGQVP